MEVLLSLVDRCERRPPEPPVLVNFGRHTRPLEDPLLRVAYGGVLQATLSEGDVEGDTPKEDDWVFLHFTARKIGALDAHAEGSLASGVPSVPFLSTRAEYGGNGRPFRFVLGKSKIMKSWEAVVSHMRVGERKLIQVRPEYHYFDGSGNFTPPRGSGVEPSTVVEFDLELADIQKVLPLDDEHERMKQYLAEGEGWETPGDMFEVDLELEGQVIEGKCEEAGGPPFVSHADLCVTVGRGALPPAVDECVRSMTLNEVSRFTLFGGSAAGPATELVPVPVGAAEVVYDIKLLGMTHIRDVMGDGQVIKRRRRQGKGQFPVDCPIHDSIVRFFCHSVRALPAGGAEPITLHEGGHALIDTHTGQGRLPEMVDTCLRIMVPDERSTLTCSPATYPFEDWQGSDSFPAIDKSKIPGGASIELDLELESFERYKYMTEQALDERLKEAKTQREMGNKLFRQGKYELAKDKYKLVLGMLEQARPETLEEWNMNDAEKIPTLLNYANVCSKLGDQREAIKYCDKLLRFDEQNVKGLYRRGMCYLLLDDHENAQENFEAMRDAGGETYTADVEAAFDKLQRSRDDAKLREKREYKAMFDKKKEIEAAKARTEKQALNMK